VGVLYAKYDLLEKMDPFMLGGGSNARFDICGNILLKNPPYKFEAGTPCIEGVLGFGEAVKYLLNVGMDNIAEYDKYLHQYFMSEMKKLENVEVYNTSGDTSIVTFNVKGIFAQDVAGYLNSKGISVRSGNHCAKILLNVIGVSETIRASLYLYNTKEEIDYFISVIKDVTLEKCIGAAI
ncbi:MAG: aminotransferase class V-fold PLP-dependent enzyme, partial [Erysipelotrichaceae bacterium]